MLVQESSSSSTPLLLALPPELLSIVAQHLWPHPEALWALMGSCKLLRASGCLTQGAPPPVQQRLYNGRACSSLARLQHAAKCALRALHMTSDGLLQCTRAAQAAIQALQLEVGGLADELQSGLFVSQPSRPERGRYRTAACRYWPNKLNLQCFWQLVRLASRSGVWLIHASDFCVCRLRDCGYLPVDILGHAHEQLSLLLQAC